MLNIGERLMLLGACFLLGAGIYWVAQSPTESELQSARFYRKLSTGYEPSTNEVRQEAQAKARGALWPAGIGVILLGVGWAMSSGGAPNPTAAPAPTEAKKNEDTSA